MAENITMVNGTLTVPDEPIIPFIEGDGTGIDIWPAAKLVLDAAVEKAYGGRRRIAWTEVLAGEKAFRETGNWLPDETIAKFRAHLIGIKGPLTTPVGGGIRSLRRVASDPRPLRVPPARALVPRRAVAREASRPHRHGDLP
jgi:isocitrate dehydrogenase